MNSTTHAAFTLYQQESTLRQRENELRRRHAERMSQAGVTPTIASAHPERPRAAVRRLHALFR